MRLAKLALLVCVSSLAVFASNLNVPACTAQPLSDYLASNSLCDVGYFLFGGFYYVGTSLGSGSAVPASAVMVTPVMGPAGPGLEFSTNWTGTADGGSDSEIGYHIGTVSGAPLIDGASMAMTATVTGTADAQLIEYLCPGGTFNDLCTNKQDVLQLYLDMGPNAGPPNTSTTFAPVSQMSVLKDVRAYGVGSGTVSISDVTNQFPVPEPATPLLCVLGLLAMWGVRKHRNP